MNNNMICSVTIACVSYLHYYPNSVKIFWKCCKAYPILCLMYYLLFLFISLNDLGERSQKIPEFVLTAICFKKGVLTVAQISNKFKN